MLALVAPTTRAVGNVRRCEAAQAAALELIAERAGPCQDVAQRCWHERFEASLRQPHVSAAPDLADDLATPTFFTELRRDGRIDRALAAARTAVRAEPDWWVPVLLLRLKSGALWYKPGFAEEKSSLENWDALLASMRVNTSLLHLDVRRSLASEEEQTSFRREAKALLHRNTELAVRAMVAEIENVTRLPDVLIDIVKTYRLVSPFLAV